MFRRARVPFLAVATLVAVAACSDSTAPKSASAPPSPEASRQQDLQQQDLQQQDLQQQDLAAERGTTGVKKGSPLSAESVRAQNWARVCNRLRTECTTFYWSGNIIYRVFAQGAAQGPGCSRDYFSVNGILIARSGLVCHVRGDVIWWDLRLRLRVPYGSLLKTDWRGSIYSPPGYVAVRF
jgi:hypothetical protein